MNDWRIFRGNTTPHDDIKNLPTPPSWRRFSLASKDINNKDLDSTDNLQRDETFISDDEFIDIEWEHPSNQKRGKTFRIPETQNELVDIVNASLYLRRPLLVTGKPGTGKTSLAYAVAYELKLGSVLLWPITARSTFKEGLYRYDAISRLQDVEVRSSYNLLKDKDKNTATNQELLEDKGENQSIGRYIQLGPVGTALLPYKRPRVLLIDEIDKSDINVPNDLLNLFEEGEYEIPELARISDIVDKVKVGTYDRQKAWIKSGRVRSYQFPFIIMTSNGERDFPPAFLRRCLRLSIKVPPNEKDLMEIVKTHLEKPVLKTYEPLISKLIEQFLEHQKKGDLATDQLLNAVYLVTRNSSMADPDKDRLANLLLKHLNSMDN